MKRLMSFVLCLSMILPVHGHTEVIQSATTPQEVLIRLNNKGSDDSNIVLNVQVSGSNDKDIAKIVDLITSLLQKLDPSSSISVQQQSWISQNPVLAMVLFGGLCAAGAAGFVYWQSR